MESHVEFLKEIISVMQKNEKDGDSRQAKIDFGRMVLTLCKYLSSKDQETQATALQWINSFVTLAKTKLLAYTPLLLSSILPILAHSVATLKNLVIDANTNLYEMVVAGEVGNGDRIDIGECVETLLRLTGDQNEDTRIGALEWVLLLHRKYPDKVQL